MRIAILNDISLNGRHLARLRAVGTVLRHADTIAAREAARRLKAVEIAVLDGFKLPVTRSLIETAAELRHIVLTSTAFHMVDLGAATERGIKIANIPAYSTEAVAEHAVALLLAAMRAIAQADRAMRVAPFQIDPGNAAHRAFLGRELRGRTLGVVGLGAIGRRVAELGLGLGMTVIGWNRTARPVAGVRSVGLDELLQLSDVVSLHVAVHSDTENIISQRELGLMKRDAVLINTAGGELVDTAALYQALSEGRVGAAGLDVIRPWDRANPLLGLDNVVLSPQSAAWTEEAGVRLADGVVATIEAFARGKPTNIVN
jgi:lactate dehydrogenase-like 2-hydroxyacid dehydrogenase